MKTIITVLSMDEFMDGFMGLNLWGTSVEAVLSDTGDSVAIKTEKTDGLWVMTASVGKEKIMSVSSLTEKAEMSESYLFLNSRPNTREAERLWKHIASTIEFKDIDTFKEIVALNDDYIASKFIIGSSQGAVTKYNREFRASAKSL